MRNAATDYDQYAPTYAWARQAVPWVVNCLARAVANLPGGARVVEVGCGTGNYTRALAALRDDLCYLGLDISRPMLRQAAARRGVSELVAGDASRGWPLRAQACDLTYAVDVIHHIEDVQAFFSEARRVLQQRGNLLLVTDSEETLRRRSLTRFFPEIMSIELARYPPIADLHRIAAECGLHLQGDEPAEGDIPLTDEFVRSLEARCSSAIRLLAQSDFDAGMARVRAAQSRGEAWRSCYVVLRYGASGAGATA